CHWTPSAKRKVLQNLFSNPRQYSNAIPLPFVGAGWGGGDVGTSSARRLRQNRTEAERALWARLRRKQLDGVRFRQQVPLGGYVVDFLCFERRLIVEVDGGQHSLAMPADQART